MLLSLQKALEFGQSLGANGVIPPWAGIWPIIIATSLFAAYIFRKSAYKMGQPPLTSISFYIDHAISTVRSRIRTVLGRRPANA